MSLIVFSFIYTTKIFTSPVYYITPALAIALAIKDRKVKKLPLILALSMITTIGIQTIKYNTHGAIMNAAIAALVFPIITYSVDKTNTHKLISYTKRAYFLIIAFYIIELALRISIPEKLTPDIDAFNFHINNEETLFYAYKYGSFSFVDSNLTAIILLILLSIGVTLKKQEAITLKPIIINYILIIMCFSRAAIIGVAIIMVSGLPKKIRLPVALTILACASSLVLHMILTDPSLATKFVIYERLFDNINQSNFSELLFGKGFGWFVEEYGMASHSIIVQSIIEGGLIFTALSFLIYIKAGALSSKQAGIFFIAVLIPSLSASIYVLIPSWVVAITISSKIMKAEIS